jgi:hypothetical protein
MRLGALLRLGLGIVDGRKGSTPVTWRSPGKGRHQAMRQQACISDPLPRKMQCPAGRPWLYAGVTAHLGARGFLHFRLLSVVRDGSSSSRVVRRTCGRWTPGWMDHRVGKSQVYSSPGGDRIAQQRVSSRLGSFPMGSLLAAGLHTAWIVVTANNQFEAHSPRIPCFPSGCWPRSSCHQRQVDDASLPPLAWTVPLDPNIAPEDGGGEGLNITDMSMCSRAPRRTSSAQEKNE